jgi:hypothetical protein
MIMENSSSVDMKEVFNHLAQIKKAEPNTNLYEKTWSKINRQNMIPMPWVRVAACLLVAFFSTELYFTLITKHSNYQDISSFIYQTNNILYNE